MRVMIHLDLLPDKGVQQLVMPLSGAGRSRPLGIPTVAQAQSDLETFWALSAPRAQAAISEMERTGHVEISATIEEGRLSRLF
jgi:hypothetical protein